MAEIQGFQHISVTPAEDEEIVIRAGKKSRATVVTEPAVEVAAPAVEVAAPAASAAPAAPMTAEEAADAKAEAQLRAAEAGTHNLTWALQQAIAEESVNKPKKEGYRETTLEDLESVPMSSMQKTVLLVMGILLAVFAVYCVLHFGMKLF